MNLIDISRQKAEEIFPDETWIEIYKNVYVAAGRKPVNSEREKVFRKELAMAKIASDKKNPDSVMDGFLTEFKNVTGGTNAISHRFREALRQGVNVYLKIDSAVPVKRIKQVLRGVLLHKENTGTVYCYISKSGMMYCWQMTDLK